MQRIETITDEQKKYAIDLLVTMVAEELGEKQKIDSAKALSEFIASETGKLLYDETSILWWNGPSYIVDMYLKEKKMVN